MHQAVGLDLRQQAELRIEHGNPGEIDVVVAQLGEDIAEPRGRVGLEAGRADIAQHRVIAGLVGLIERQQRGADQDQDTIQFVNMMSPGGLFDHICCSTNKFSRCIPIGELTTLQINLGRVLLAFGLFTLRIPLVEFMKIRK